MTSVFSDQESARRAACDALGIEHGVTFTTYAEADEALREEVVAALKARGGSMARVARQLGVAQGTVRHWLAGWGIHREVRFKV